MIQVLLLILKIIGITLLVILGLILLVLCLVLFVPVFYRVRVIYNPEKTQVKARASFLFPLILVTFEYLKQVKYKVRLFGFALLDSEKPKKEKKQKKTTKKEKKKNKKSKTKEPEQPKSSPEPVTESADEAVLESAVNETAKTPDAWKEPVPELEEKNEQAEKQSFFEKVKCKIQKIRETKHNLIKNLKKLLHQKNEVQKILAKPETKKAIAFAWGQLKHLLKHVLPRKMKGYVAYGADNPATTGQVLGILSVVYARTGMLLEIRPNFQEKQLECDVELKGRIQAVTLLVIAVKVVMNQELRQLIADVKKLKEIE